MLQVTRSLDPKLDLKYNKFYIGAGERRPAEQLCDFRPQKNAIRIEPRLQKTDAIEQRVEAAGLDAMDYDNKWGRYRVRLGKGDVKKHADVLRELFEAAYRDSGAAKE